MLQIIKQWFSDLFKKNSVQKDKKSFVEDRFAIRPLEEFKIGSLVTIEFVSRINSILIFDIHSLEQELGGDNIFPPKEIRLEPAIKHQYIVCSFYYPKDKDKWIGPQVVLYDFLNNRHLLFDCSFLGFYQDPLTAEQKELMYERMARAMWFLEISHEDSSVTK